MRWPTGCSLANLNPVVGVFQHPILARGLSDHLALQTLCGLAFMKKLTKVSFFGVEALKIYLLCCDVGGRIVFYLCWSITADVGLWVDMEMIPVLIINGQDYFQGPDSI